jgi:hypothetical protein
VSCDERTLQWPHKSPRQCRTNLRSSQDKDLALVIHCVAMGVSGYHIDVFMRVFCDLQIDWRCFGVPDRSCLICIAKYNSLAALEEYVSLTHSTTAVPPIRRNVWHPSPKQTFARGSGDERG